MIQTWSLTNCFSEEIYRLKCEKTDESMLLQPCGKGISARPRIYKSSPSGLNGCSWISSEHLCALHTAHSNIGKYLIKIRPTLTYKNPSAKNKPNALKIIIVIANFIELRSGLIGAPTYFRARKRIVTCFRRIHLRVITSRSQAPKYTYVLSAERQDPKVKLTCYTQEGNVLSLTLTCYRITERCKTLQLRVKLSLAKDSGFAGGCEPFVIKTKKNRNEF